MHEAQLLLRRQGMSIKDIAMEIGKSERTVYCYLSKPLHPRIKRHLRSLIWHG